LIKLLLNFILDLFRSPALTQKKIEHHQKQHDKLKKLLQKSKGLPVDSVIKKQNNLQAKVSSRLPPVTGTPINNTPGKRNTYYTEFANEILAESTSPASYQVNPLGV
jgi:hypothetical protein